MPQGVTDSTASQAFLALPAMASKAPQGTRATQECPARRALQEIGAPQDWACLAPKASVVSPETTDYLGHQASPGLLAPQAPLDR